LREEEKAGSGKRLYVDYGVWILIFVYIEICTLWTTMSRRQDVTIMLPKYLFCSPYYSEPYSSVEGQLDQLSRLIVFIVFIVYFLNQSRGIYLHNAKNCDPNTLRWNFSDMKTHTVLLRYSFIVSATPPFRI
jgi:hypothetical protein